ncbi:MAG: hypothetical protein WCY92_02865 [Novosphingobium sp.]
MEYEIDFQLLDPITNNPSLDNGIPVNPLRRAMIAADLRNLRNGKGPGVISRQVKSIADSEIAENR